MSTMTRTARSPLPVSRDSGFLARKLVGRLTLGLSAARERRALRALDDARLTDIGVDARAALREAKRPFWSVRDRG